MFEKLDKLFGKRDGQEKSVPVVEVSPRPATPRPILAPPAPPPASSPAPACPVPPLAPEAGPPSPLRPADVGHTAEARAKVSIAAAAAALPEPAFLRLPDGAGVRERAAAYFATGEHKRAIDMLVGHLNQTAGNAPRAIWFMLMDAYQALGQQAAFEKSAWLFAGFFKTSPPSWSQSANAPAPTSSMGRNVLVIDGSPSAANKEKIRDFLAAAKAASRARLDLSRARLSEEHAQRSDDLRMLMDLMRKLRRREIPTLLMGENQLVEILRGVIQQDIPVPQPELYWELLLEFMQWRGQEDAYEDLAISFARRFARSAPGYEACGVVASAPTGLEGHPGPQEDTLAPPQVLDEQAMEAWCARLSAAQAGPPSVEEPLRLDFSGVRTVAFAAAGQLAANLRQWAWPAEALLVEAPSELIHALFDITGVSGQARILPRRR